MKAFLSIILILAGAFTVLCQQKTSPTRKAVSKPASLASESLPQKISADTAVSPLYKLNSKYCKNRDRDAGEGDEFRRECKAYGNYVLTLHGSDYRINYGIASSDPKTNFLVMLFPLENGAAAKYARTDRYDEKLADKIEWLLNAQGKPYAIIVHAAFYKNTGSAKTFNNPANKAAEFVLLRGLAGYEKISEDLPTVDTPYNPDERARMIASRFLKR